jgi:hypothetical protein
VQASWLTSSRRANCNSLGGCAGGASRGFTRAWKAAPVGHVTGCDLPSALDLVRSARSNLSKTALTSPLAHRPASTRIGSAEGPATLLTPLSASPDERPGRRLRGLDGNELDVNSCDLR